MLRRIIKFIVFITIITVINPVKPVFGQTRGFTVSPPTLKFTLEPGQKTEKIIKITNNSDEEMEFFANVQDFVVTNNQGTPELLPEGVKPDNQFAASTWTAVIPDSFVVKPHQSAMTTLYLQVPGDARPGGRYVSVAFRPLNQSSEESSGASINTVVGSLVYLTVQGETKESARVTLFNAPSFSEYGPVTFNTEIKNLGDLHINPRAEVEIKDLLGRGIYNFALDNLNIFPGTSRVYQNRWPQKWLFGRFTATLAGYYGLNSDQPLTAVFAFWVIPYKLILVVLLALAIIIVGIFYLQKRRSPEVK